MTVAMVIRLAAVMGWEQQRPEWADVAWLAMRVHVTKVGRRGRGGGGDVIDVEGKDVDAPLCPPQPKAESPPTNTCAPPPKARRTSTPAERPGGDVAKWLLQQQQSEPWHVRSLSSETAARYMEQHLP